nr:MAG TPA: conotoxin [Caudoviricetes sp.]
MTLMGGSSNPCERQCLSYERHCRSFYVQQHR